MRKKILCLFIIIVLISTLYSCDKRSTSTPNQTGLAILYPRNGDTIGDSITVKITVGEIQGVTRVDLYIDGDSTFSDTLPLYQFFWSTHNVTTGENHTLYAEAVTADSIYVSDTITVSVQIASGFHLLSECQITGSAVMIIPDSEGRYLYVAASDNGVAIIDNSNPYEATPLPNNITGSAHAVDIWENYLFIAERQNGVTVWDITDPNMPVSIDRYDTPGNALNLVFDPIDSMLYVADGDALQIIKLDNTFQFLPWTWLGSTATVNDVAINGNYAHLGTADGLRIVDISNPLSPFYVTGGVFQTTTVRGISSFGDVDYLALGAQGIKLVSIAVLSAPSFIADFDTPGDAHAITFQSGGSPDILFVADGNGGVSAFGYTEGNPGQIVSLGWFDTQGYAYDIVFQNGLIYVADNSRALILRYVE